jgi:hypothetical protein
MHNENYNIDLLYMKNHRTKKGGSPKTYNSIITTHQARLRCLVESITGESPIERFMNSCVLKINVIAVQTSIELIHAGEVDEEKPNYIYYVPNVQDWANQHDNYRVVSDDGNSNIYTVFSTDSNKPKYKITEFEERFIPKETPNANNNTFKFYLVRHGQAIHNLRTSKLKKAIGQLPGNTDTILTSEGEKQAYSAGKSLSNIFKNLNINYLFSSDLMRTRETIGYLVNGIYCDSANMKCTIMGELPIYVLPCAHELTYTPNKRCDGNQGLSAKENIMNCTSTNLKCLKIMNHSVNWDYYTEFYQGTRSNFCRSCKRKRCRSTNMIQEAVTIINDKEGNGRSISTINSSLHEENSPLVSREESEELEKPKPKPKSKSWFSWPFGKKENTQQQAPTTRKVIPVNKDDGIIQGGRRKTKRKRYTKRKTRKNIRKKRM